MTSDCARRAAIVPKLARIAEDPDYGSALARAFQYGRSLFADGPRAISADEFKARLDSMDDPDEIAAIGAGMECRARVR